MISTPYITINTTNHKILKFYNYVNANKSNQST